MHVLIAGGTGAIGRRLVTHLINHGHIVTVISRAPYKPATLAAKISFAQWDGKTAAGWGHLAENVDAIVNLAGAGIADERWTDERKAEIINSRVNAGKAIVEAIAAAENKPETLIQASAIGYYQSGKDVLTESSPMGQGFLPDVCKQWEASTEAVEAMGVRRVVIRTGVVLDTKGGALPKMLLPFRFFAGGPVGLGRQWLSWIHYLDEVDAIRFLLEHKTIEGVVNLTAPHPLQNRHFASAIGQAMKRPALAPAPSFALKMLFGEMSTVLLDGHQVLPRRLEEAGYEFNFTHADAALEALLAA